MLAFGLFFLYAVPPHVIELMHKLHGIPRVSATTAIIIVIVRIEIAAHTHKRTRAPREMLPAKTGYFYSICVCERSRRALAGA